MLRFITSRRGPRGRAPASTASCVRSRACPCRCRPIACSAFCALVVDGDSEPAGLVTLQDVISELLGHADDVKARPEGARG